MKHLVSCAQTFRQLFPHPYSAESVCFPAISASRCGCSGRPIASRPACVTATCSFVATSQLHTSAYCRLCDIISKAITMRSAQFDPIRGRAMVLTITHLPLVAEGRVWPHALSYSSFGEHWHWGRLLFECFGFHQLPEWYWQRKTKVLGEKPVPLPRWPPRQMTWDRTQAFAVQKTENENRELQLRFSSYRAVNTLRLG